MNRRKANQKLDPSKYALPPALYQNLLETQLKIRYLNLYLLVLYLALPSTTIKIFEAYACVDVKDEVTNTVTYYLEVNLTPKCNPNE